MNSIKSILFVTGIIMIFTAQVNAPDDHGQHHASAPHAAIANNVQHTAPRHNATSRPAVQNHPQVPNHRVVAQQGIHHAPPTAQNRAFQHSAQRTASAPRIYGIPVPKDARRDRSFHHHQHWQPLYNFYGNEYHFYPYVNITTPVELSDDFVTILFNGQTYYYDQGSFYVQDPQGYLATPPPIGIIVSLLPSNARQITTDSQVYYRYKGVCYVQVPQGYQVIDQIQSVSDNT